MKFEYFYGGTTSQKIDPIYLSFEYLFYNTEKFAFGAEAKVGYYNLSIVRDTVTVNNMNFFEFSLSPIAHYSFKNNFDMIFGYTPKYLVRDTKMSKVNSDYKSMQKLYHDLFLGMRYYFHKDIGIYAKTYYSLDSGYGFNLELGASFRF